MANAAYRAGVNAEAEREEVLRAIDGAIGVYLGVLQESPDHPDAAYNYEYLIRLRADIAAGADIPMGSVNPNGREGRVTRRRGFGGNQDLCSGAAGCRPGDG